jgi:hypothetical protein
VKTDDLIDLLSTNVEPVARRQVGRIVGAAIAAAALALLAVIVFVFGIRADLTREDVLNGVMLKLGFMLVIIGFASVYLVRVARPGGERRTPLAFAIVPFAAIVLLAMANLALAPRSYWETMVARQDWVECVLSIPIIAVLPFAIVIWAVRKMAPTDLVRTGALAGLVAGSLSVAGFALHCADDALPLVVLWYGATIGLCTFAGAMLGPRLLRW